MELSDELIVDFLAVNGGKVESSVLLEHFKNVFPADPQRRASVRGHFKSCVDRVAFVKSDSGRKLVCLRKKFLVPVTNFSGRAESTACDVTQPPPEAETGSESQVRVPQVSLQVGEKRREQWHAEDGRAAMGNVASCRQPKPRAVPRITVIQASPLLVDGAVFNMPEPAAAAGLPGKAPEHLGSGSDGEDEVNDVMMDTRSLSGSDSNSPTNSRRHFLELMMSSSADVRRHSVALSRGDSDVMSVGSSTVEEDRAAITLDPLEHEWMLCSSDSEWSSQLRLLTSDPGLVLKKDFVSGFTCLHWAAKHGKPELIAMIVNFSKQHGVPLSVDVRSSTGYTPLHLAAMHGHVEVVKLLVGAYDADVEVRDYSGRKACHYLSSSLSLDMHDIIGARDDPQPRHDVQGSPRQDGARWMLSKVLQANLKPLRLPPPEGWDPAGGEGHLREVPLRRKSSLSRMKPKFQRIRSRASQLVHSTSFGEKQEGEEPMRRSFLSRPKTHWFG